ncbi:MAG: FtsX-like permease family protein, partial [Gammaproteobacteria bacterium]|nr:FtsX-like permease family protein [Gammaproteobacteria bacterium]
MQAWQVLVQVLIESTILMLIGIGFGLLIGILLYLGYQDGIDLTSFAAGMEYAGMAPKFKPSLHVNDIQVIVFLSLALGVLASLYPARRAMKLSPLEAIKR